MSKIIAAHQPNFLPYLGFFDKMQKCDIFVIRDEVLYVKKEYHNRNKIRINGGKGFKWINVPVVKLNDYIKHIFIKKDFFEKNHAYTQKRDCFQKKIPWNKKLSHEIKEAYNKSKYFNEFYPEIERIFDNNNDKLIELNIKLINFLKEVFGIKTKIVIASELGLKPEHYSPEGDASCDLINICKKLRGDIYLSGIGGKNYLNLEKFDERSIEIKFQEYKHPVYKQRFPDFIPNMAAIDALFCVGRIP